MGGEVGKESKDDEVFPAIGGVRGCEESVEEPHGQVVVRDGIAESETRDCSPREPHTAGHCGETRRVTLSGSLRRRIAV